MYVPTMFIVKVGEILSLQNEPDNTHYQFSVGHVPKAASRIIFHFLSRDGHTGICEVNGNRLNHGVNLGMEVPCIYRFYGRQRYIDRLNSMLQES